MCVADVVDFPLIVFQVVWIPLVHFHDDLDPDLDDWIWDESLGILILLF